MDFVIRALIALGGIIAAFQYGVRVGAWWARYTRLEKLNRIGWGIILLGLVEGAFEAAVAHLAVGPRNYIILAGLLCIVGGYWGMRRRQRKSCGRDREHDHHSPLI